MFEHALSQSNNSRKSTAGRKVFNMPVVLRNDSGNPLKEKQYSQIPADLRLRYNSKLKLSPNGYWLHPTKTKRIVIQ